MGGYGLPPFEAPSYDPYGRQPYAQQPAMPGPHPARPQSPGFAPPGWHPYAQQPSMPQPSMPGPQPARPQSPGFARPDSPGRASSPERPYAQRPPRDEASPERPYEQRPPRDDGRVSSPERPLIPERQPSPNRGSKERPSSSKERPGRRPEAQPDPASPYERPPHTVGHSASRPGPAPMGVQKPEPGRPDPASPYERPPQVLGHAATRPGPAPYRPSSPPLKPADPAAPPVRPPVLLGHVANRPGPLPTAARPSPKIPPSACDPKPMPVNTVESVFGHIEPMRPRNIPGTSEPWSAPRVADLIHGALHKIWHRASDARQVLDLIFALPVEDRQAVAAAYHQRTGGLDLTQKILGVLTGRSRLMARAYLENESGQLEAHDALALSTSGVGNDEQSVLRLLGGMAREQVSATSEAMLRRYGVTLHARLSKALSGPAQRAALFLLDAPREKGRIPETAMRAYDVHEALCGWISTDRERVFRALEGCDRTQVKEVSEHYRALFGEDMRTRLEHRMSGFFKNPLWRERLDLAFRGLRQDADAAADYAAVSLHLALSGFKADGESILHTLSTVVSPDGARHPTGHDVAEKYQRRFGPTLPPEFSEAHGLPMEAPLPPRRWGLFRGATQVRHLAAVGGAGLVRAAARPGGLIETLAKRIKNPMARQLAMLALQGASLEGPATDAMRLGHARKTGLIGRPDPQMVRAVLDKPNLSPEGRRAYLAEVKAEYAAMFGEFKNRKDTDALERHIIRDFGAWASTRPPVPTAELSLVRKGTLTPAERLFHALHGKSLLGMRSTVDTAAIFEAMRGMSAIDKIHALHEYAELVGRPLDLAQGQNPLVQDLRSKMRARDFRLADQLLSIFPGDERALLDEIRSRVDQDATRELAHWVKRHYGSTRAMAAKHARAPQELQGIVDTQLRRARGHALSAWICDVFGPEGKNVEARVRQLRRDIEIGVELANRDGKICKSHVDRLQRSYGELQSTLHDYLQHKDLVAERAALTASTVAVAVATVLTSGAASPLIGLLVPAAAGAAARVAAKGVVLGMDYRSPKEVGYDLAVGAAVGAAAAGMTDLIPFLMDLGSGGGATVPPATDGGAHGVLPPGVGAQPVPTPIVVPKPVVTPTGVGFMPVAG